MVEARATGKDVVRVPVPAVAFPAPVVAFSVPVVAFGRVAA